MYDTLLVIHSVLRWLLLIGLLIAIYKAYQGWFSNKPFLKIDNTLRLVTATIAHVQLLVGIGLYLISPIMSTFLNTFPESMSNSEMRFFGMEHSFMMLLAIVFITIGSSKAKRKTTDKAKFKTIAIWFTIALIVIIVAIPWSFLPFSPDRPFFRIF